MTNDRSVKETVEALKRKAEAKVGSNHGDAFNRELSRLKTMYGKHLTVDEDPSAAPPKAPKLTKRELDKLAQQKKQAERSKDVASEQAYEKLVVAWQSANDLARRKFIKAVVE